MANITLYRDNSDDYYNNQPIEYQITKEAYEALLAKWRYTDWSIPLIAFNLQENEEILPALIKFIKQNFEPLFEMEGEQLKDTIALIFIKLKLAIKEDKNNLTSYNNALDALITFAQITKNQIEHKNQATAFSIGTNIYSYEFLPDATLINLEIKHILAIGNENYLYASFYHKLPKLLNEEEITSFLDNFIASETLKKNLPNFQAEVIEIKNRFEALKKSKKVISPKEALERLMFDKNNKENIPNINCIFDLSQFIENIKKDINENSADAFINEIKKEIISLKNKIQLLAKDESKNHLTFLYNDIRENYSKILNYLGLFIDKNSELKVRPGPVNQLKISYNNCLLGLDSTKILSIFAQVLKINGTNTKNIPKIVDYYLQILSAEFARSLDEDKNEAFKKFNNLKITQIPYLENELILMKEYVEHNPEIFGTNQSKALYYLTSLESQITVYETFFKTNITASNAQLVKFLTDALEEDKKSIQSNKEPTAFTETFEKIARLLFLKSLYKDQEIDVNSSKFTKDFEDAKLPPLAGVLKNEDVKKGLNEIINQTKKWELEEKKVIKKQSKKWHFIDKEIVKTDTPASTLIILHKATILNKGIPTLEKDPHSR